MVTAQRPPCQGVCQQAPEIKTNVAPVTQSSVGRNRGSVVTCVRSGQALIMTEKMVYRVIFINHGKTYEIYAREVSQGAMFGFIEIGDLVFGEKSALLVDPSEERLKSEFSGVKRFYVPMHAVVRIDEVEKEGTGKISEISTGNVTPFPGIYPPTGGSDGTKS